MRACTGAVALLGLLLLCASPSARTQTDLTGIKICIDPGHGGHNPANDRHLIPDPGTDFWESESNLQKAFLLKPLLEARGATVLLTRSTNDYPDDGLEPSLSARVALANANNVDWFHSIHSNAVGNDMQTTTAINYTLMLVREKRSLTDPAASSGSGLGIPEQAASVTMANIMGPAIQAKLRDQARGQYTWLDWTFYGGNNGGFSLGVLRGLLMPGELSEGSMHDYAPETRRLMNNSYRKMEAYALRNSFMQYYGVPADTLCIVAGIQSDSYTGKLLNLTRVRVLPENLVYTGDQYNNGFYMLDGLQAGPHLIRFETPGYYPDSVSVTLTAGGTAFIDRALVSSAAPAVVASIPTRGDTLFPHTGSVQLTFSKPMDTASVRAAFSFTPFVPGTLSWSTNILTLTFRPDTSFTADQSYSLRIDTTARAADGLVIDGNGDAVPGDPFVLSFRTRFKDVVPPRITAVYPDSLHVVRSPDHVINITFDEPLKESSYAQASNLMVQQVGSSLQGRTVDYAQANGKGGLTLFVNGGLLPGRSYRVKVIAMSDTLGNAMPTVSPVIWGFSVGGGGYTRSLIDSLQSAVNDWWQPSGSGSTTGLTSASFQFDAARRIPVITGNAGSAQLAYTWNTAASAWLLREYLNGGPGKQVRWRKENSTLQAYLYGDGSRTQFRFCVDDSLGHEVSAWTTIDWVGWRLVEWNMDSDSLGTWIGDGKLDGQLNFESFQLRYVPGVSLPAGQIWLDQLQVVQQTPTAVAEGPAALPASYALYQNYPNPFNPATTILFDLPADAFVVLKVYNSLGQLVATPVEEMRRAGTHRVIFDASGLASGVYFYRLTGGAFSAVRKFVLLK